MAGSGSIQLRAVDRSNGEQWMDPMACRGWIQWREGAAHAPAVETGARRGVARLAARPREGPHGRHPHAGLALRIRSRGVASAAHSHSALAAAGGDGAVAAAKPIAATVAAAAAVRAGDDTVPPAGGARGPWARQDWR
eukprot:814699-Prorocentrum_minimum.AAC.1